MRENDEGGPAESEFKTEPCYYGPCAKCGGVHGGWEVCEVLNRPLAYDADVRETLDAYLACAVARVTGDGYDHARHAATKRALDALLGALCRDRARACQADLAATTMAARVRRTAQHLAENGWHAQAIRLEEVWASVVAALDHPVLNHPVAPDRAPWPPPHNGCSPRPMGDAVVTALQAWYEEKRRTGYEGPGEEQDLYRAVEAATRHDDATRRERDAA